MQLKKEKVRFLVAIAGVAFAALLMLMQLGFRSAMFESAVRYHTTLDYDVVLISAETTFLPNPVSFAKRRLYQTLGVEGVASIAPVYADPGIWKNPFTHVTRPLLVIGFDPDDRVLPLPDVQAQVDAIRLQDAVLFDGLSRPEFGPVATTVASNGPLSVELNNRRVQVVGTFRQGSSFGIDGSVLTSDANFLRIFPRRSPGLIDLGLIRLRPGADPDRVRDAIRELLPGDVRVFTRADYVKFERDYWDQTTPIGYVFGFGVLMAIVVGAIIVYQILFADVADHLAEYATLKAMGYPDRFLFAVVLEQAAILAALGFLPGAAAAWWLYGQAGQATRLPLELTPERAISVLGLTFGMCVVSGLLALRKLRGADPAEIF
jgi:putative ABC transport system permease protein